MDFLLADPRLGFCFLGKHGEFLKGKSGVRQEEKPTNKKPDSEIFFNRNYRTFIWKFSP